MIKIFIAVVAFAFSSNAFACQMLNSGAGTVFDPETTGPHIMFSPGEEFTLSLSGCMSEPPASWYWWTQGPTSNTPNGLGYLGTSETFTAGIGRFTRGQFNVHAHTVEESGYDYGVAYVGVAKKPNAPILTATACVYNHALGTNVFAISTEFSDNDPYEYSNISYNFYTDNEFVGNDWSSEEDGRTAAILGAGGGRHVISVTAIKEYPGVDG